MIIIITVIIIIIIIVVVVVVMIVVVLSVMNSGDFLNSDNSVIQVNFSNGESLERLWKSRGDRALREGLALKINLP